MAGRTVIRGERAVRVWGTLFASDRGELPDWGSECPRRGSLRLGERGGLVVWVMAGLAGGLEGGWVRAVRVWRGFLRLGGWG